jgi:hypothetical protein
MPAPTFRSATTAGLNGSGSTSFTLSVPSGSVVGDLLIYTAYVTTGQLNSIPSGWLSVPNMTGADGSGIGGIYTFYYYRAAATPTSWSFPCDAYSYILGFVAAIKDVNSVALLGQSSQVQNQNSSIIQSPSLLPNQSDDLLLCPMFNSNSTDFWPFGAVSGMVNRWGSGFGETQQDVTNERLKTGAFFTQNLSSGNATGVKQSALAGSSNGWGGSLIVRSGVAPVVTGAAGLFFGQLF